MRLVLSRLGAARARADRRLHRAAPASRSTRATASPRPPRSSPPRCAARVPTPALGRRRRCRASRSGWSTRPATQPSDEDPGEIHVRGDNLFSGYWPDGADGPDADGWWATGDVGYLDPDGDLYLVDRLKELVIVSGFNVYPVEVEDVIGELPEVAEVAVIGVARRGDRRGGRRLRDARRAAGAERRAGRRRAPPLRRAAGPLQAARRSSHVVDQLPYTATGKVQKGRLRAPSAAAPSGCWRSGDRARARPASPSTASPAATCATRPARSSSGSAPSSARRTTRSTSTPRPSCWRPTASRCRSPSSTAGSTTSGAWTRPRLRAALRLTPGAPGPGSPMW